MMHTSWNSPSSVALAITAWNGWPNATWLGRRCDPPRPAYRENAGTAMPVSTL
jgi:hypothetical protein